MSEILNKKSDIYLKLFRNKLINMTRCVSDYNYLEFKLEEIVRELIESENFYEKKELSNKYIENLKLQNLAKARELKFASSLFKIKNKEFMKFCVDELKIYKGLHFKNNGNIE